MGHRREFTKPECERIKLLHGLGLSSVQIAVRLKSRPGPIRDVIKRGFTTTAEAIISARGRKRPDDFAIVYPTGTHHEIARHYRTGPAVIARWADELGIRRKMGDYNRGKQMHKPIERPAGFRAFYEANGWNATQAHYGISRGTLHKWVHETGGTAKIQRKRKAPAAPAIIAPPPGYEDFKRKLGRPRDMFGMAA